MAKIAFRSSLATLAVLLSFTATADPIIVSLTGGDGVDTLGGYTMTDFGPVSVPNEGCGESDDGAYSADSPISGTVDFMEQGGITPLCMTVQDPGWWQEEYDHGNVFTTSETWVELIMPDDTRAFSLYVGGNMGGHGWIEGVDSAGNTTRTYFGGDTGIAFGDGSSPGFGVYSGSCETISKIIIEPFEWGTGEFAINQGSCVSVPEPAPIGLLALGLLCLGLSRKFANGGMV